MNNANKFNKNNITNKLKYENKNEFKQEQEHEDEYEEDLNEYEEEKNPETKNENNHQFYIKRKKTKIGGNDVIELILDGSQHPSLNEFKKRRALKLQSTRVADYMKEQIKKLKLKCKMIEITNDENDKRLIDMLNAYQVNRTTFKDNSFLTVSKIKGKDTLRVYNEMDLVDDHQFDEAYGEIRKITHELHGMNHQ
jgi:hypothetical protein